LSRPARRREGEEVARQRGTERKKKKIYLVLCGRGHLDLDQFALVGLMIRARLRVLDRFLNLSNAFFLPWSWPWV